MAVVDRLLILEESLILEVTPVLFVGLVVRPVLFVRLLLLPAVDRSLPWSVAQLPDVDVRSEKGLVCSPPNGLCRTD